MIGELSFNHNSWKNNRGNFHVIQFTKAQAVSVYKYYLLMKDGLSGFDVLTFGIDKYKMFTSYGKSSINRLKKKF